ncbi:chromosome segregation protein SMC [Peribacillus saganii]|uniref:Chromosome partition protein Smc n=1 Tax=Peribacillus saganii TaxID=2303992 RepID=A0A372LDJ6_9BACI|nr:chromosome segregation protein SMC [Peribacillus saganii]RFU63240.1 chromosome segregation protein SMC [Peribacillus saganii]
MFLKRLDVVGFKSFAERISVEFVPGVTAVVGPNGSGKSNITDAIRWVLGEQSAKSLRGAKMEDIIFAGSDSRKAVNFAEVSLTLDNGSGFLPIDYQEVSVTRRVYRSGDSEFLINKQPCRLKDIVDLFMDSGLGKEAFSIISQGKVEEILSSKSEERRIIFEEAAGVLKYKSRKRKAESKLSETQENLNRVQDILHELEGQVEPLKIQASIAADYLEKKEELEQIEVALTVFEIESLHEKWQSISKELEKHSDMEVKQAAELQKKEAELEEARDRVTALDESINDLQEVLLQASEELEKLEGRKEVLKERKKNASQNKQGLEKSIEEASTRIKALELEKIAESQGLELLEQEVKDLTGTLQEKQKQLSAFNSNLEEIIETLKSDYIEWLNKQATANNEIRYLEQQISQQDHKNTRLDKENSRYIVERKNIGERKTALMESLKALQQEIEDHVTFFRNEQRKLDNVKSAYQKQETTLYQAYQFLQQAKSRKEMLEEMEDEYAGFFQGVKEVLKAKDRQLAGIEGAVAELITVPRDYQIAIETALGGATQHVVTANEEHARNAIAFLKKYGYGRATFLPLSVIKGRQIPETQLSYLKNHQAFIGTAADLLDFDEKYRFIITNLLGTVIVTKDLRGANELAKLVQHKYRFVTLEGDVVNPGGSMTGGAVKQKTASLLSRKGELEELKTRLSGMEEKTAKLEEHVKKLKADIASQEEKIEDIRKAGEALRMDEQSIKGDSKQVELEEKNVNERLRLYDLEKSSLNEEQESRTNRLGELRDQLADCQSSISRLDKEIAELTKQKQTQQSSKETLSQETNDLKVTLASKSSQLYNQQENVNRITMELTALQEKLEEYQDDLSLLTNEMHDNSSGEHILEKAAAMKSQDKQEAITLISTRRRERMELHALVEDMEIGTKELKRIHKGLAEVVKDDEVKLNRLDVELETRLDHLREEYFLTFEGAKEKHPMTMPADEAKKRVKLIKLAIEEMGTVNLGAIDEYERVSERYHFLMEQKEDLQEAKKTLFKVIEEMDDEMKKRFSDTFYAIREQFESVFKALFGGGRAELKLTEPSDLLRTGVDIIAQPPGKKLQNLGLLSGGERALTAIALLFSILKIRPVPFCILDEVEAALDEANVLRFSQYLKHFSSQTQFIVITHRKGTMEEADVLYGVTMQESGVSKLVSVRIDESKEFAEI